MSIKTHLDQIEQWLAAQERPGAIRFGCWKPKDSQCADRRFYADSVEWMSGLYFVGVEDGREVSFPLWEIELNWERVL